MLGLVPEEVVAGDPSGFQHLARDAEAFFHAAPKLVRHAGILPFAQDRDVVQTGLHGHVQLGAAQHFSSRVRFRRRGLVAVVVAPP